MIYRLYPLRESEENLLLCLKNDSKAYNLISPWLTQCLEDNTLPASGVFCRINESRHIRKICREEFLNIKNNRLNLVFHHWLSQVTEDYKYDGRQTWFEKVLEVSRMYETHDFDNYFEEITEEFKKHKDAAKEFCEDSKALHKKVTLHIQQQENKTMPLIENVKITNVTYLDGRDVKDISDQELITAIQAKESRIEALRKQKTESKRVNQIINELNTDIEKLVEILDSRVVEDKNE